jgi:segregation and condensation protein B
MDDEQGMTPLGLEGFAEPSDQGLSLDELSQAYAALLKKGVDPYPDRAKSPEAAPGEEETRGQAAEPQAVLRGEDQATCEITPKSILEAMLFVGHPTGEPLLSERIAALMRGVRPAEIDDLVCELNDEYERNAAPYAVISVGAGYQLALRPEFAGLRDAFYGRVREARLSQTAIDVLAVVAYHQPLTQDEIDRLRGKPSGGVLSQLVRRDLLSLERPAEKKAKASYRTTDRFLDLFGLDDLSELPRSQELERNL